MASQIEDDFNHTSEVFSLKNTKSVGMGGIGNIKETRGCPAVSAGAAHALPYSPLVRPNSYASASSGGLLLFRPRMTRSFFARPGEDKELCFKLPLACNECLKEIDEDESGDFSKCKPNTYVQYRFREGEQQKNGRPLQKRTL